MRNIVRLLAFCIPLHVCLYSFAQINPGSNMENRREEAESISNACMEAGIQFPFNDKGRVMLSPSTMQIGSRIQELQESGLLQENMQKGILAEIIEKNWHQTRTRPIDGLVNIGAFQFAEEEVDAPLLLAAFVVSANKGSITQIAPYLEFCNVHFGRASEATPGAVGMPMLDLPADTQLTKMQRLAFFPAAQAILSFPEASVPLLKKAVMDEELHEILRLRAAFFLKAMNPDLLSEAFISQINDQEVAQKIRCGIDKKAFWRTIHTRICDNFTISPERAKSIKEYEKQVEESLSKSQRKTP